MSEPTRVRDDGSEEARALLRAAEPTHAITPVQRRRTAARVARYSTLAAAGALSWLPGAALGAALGVATGSVAWLAPRWLAPPPAAYDRGSAPNPPATAPPPSEPRREAPAPAPEPSAGVGERSPHGQADLPPPPPVTTAAVAPASSAPAADPLAQEAALLEKARAALAASPAQALALAREHAARFPAGMLRMERDIVAIDALRRLGRLGEARALGEAVLARAPGSVYEDRVRKLLESTR